MKEYIDRLNEIINKKLIIEEKEWIELSEPFLDQFEEYVQIKENGLIRGQLIDSYTNDPYMGKSRPFYYKIKEFAFLHLTICGYIYFFTGENLISIDCYIIHNGRLFKSEDDYRRFVFTCSDDGERWFYDNCQKTDFIKEMEFDPLPERFKEYFPNIGW